MGRVYLRAGKAKCPKGGCGTSLYIRHSNSLPLTWFDMKRLMSLHTIEDLTSCILDFQANIVRVAYRQKTTFVFPEEDPAHEAALNYIWERSNLKEIEDENGLPLKWRLLGFDSEDIIQEFSEVGVLGLDCLVRLYFFTKNLVSNALHYLRKNSSRLFQISPR